MSQFIQSYVPTAGSLETLLFLFDARNKAWSADAIARELRSNRRMVEDFMGYFQSKGLIVKASDSSYRLNSDQVRLVERLSELQKLYKERPVSVLNEIYRNPNRAGTRIQIFADAFKLKKD